MYKKSLLALIACIVVSASVNASANSLLNKTGETVDKAGKVISETGDKIGQAISDTSEKIGTAASQAAVQIDQYVDDSTITAKVKKAIADASLSIGFDVSVTTDNGLVTLTGFVPNIEAQVMAVKLAGEVEGVKLVSDKLNIRADKDATLSDYANDTLITSQAKAKLLAADDVPSTAIKVETVDGIVQLSGRVKTAEQAYRAEQAVKQVDGVKTVKNDLTIAP